LRKCHKIDANLKTYREHVSPTPTNPDISLILDNSKLQVIDGEVVYSCRICGEELKIGKDTSVESLKVCEHIGSEFLADFLRERMAIEQALLEKASGVRTLTAK